MSVGIRREIVDAFWKEVEKNNFTWEGLNKGKSITFKYKGVSYTIDTTLGNYSMSILEYQKYLENIVLKEVLHDDYEDIIEEEETKQERRTEMRELKADEIEVKVKQVIVSYDDKKKDERGNPAIKWQGCVALLYKTARVDMDILDETFGAMDWQSDYKTVKDNLYCGIGVKSGDEWIWRWDCGIESRADGEGNEKKGEASDAFKRAGFKWGIGRELYTAPSILISWKVDVKGDKKYLNGNPQFDVAHIDYKDGAISELTIVENKSKQNVFVWKKQEKNND